MVNLYAKSNLNAGEMQCHIYIKRGKLDRADHPLFVHPNYSCYSQRLKNLALYAFDPRSNPCFNLQSLSRSMFRWTVEVLDFLTYSTITSAIL